MSKHDAVRYASYMDGVGGGFATAAVVFLLIAFSGAQISERAAGVPRDT